MQSKLLAVAHGWLKCKAQIFPVLKENVKYFTEKYCAQIHLRSKPLQLPYCFCASFVNLNHLKAVIAHEEAHKNYHDTFYFFWLGWLKTISSWLPNTNMIWEELLLLREIRADKEAIKNIDPLVLAESLIIVARKMNLVAKNNSTSFVEVCFHDMNTNSRLEKRIKALFEMSEDLENDNSHINYLLLVLLPLLSIPFHN